MCAPIGDGAAAALICSEKGLKHFPTDIQQSAIKIKASVLSGGKYRTLKKQDYPEWLQKRPIGKLS